MKRSSLFGHIIEILDEVRTSKSPADQIVRDFFRTRHYLGSKDRRVISEILFGILRNMRFLEETLLAAEPSVGSFRRIPVILLVVAWELKFSRASIDALLPEVSGLWRVYVPELTCEETLAKVSIVDLALSIEPDPVRRIAIQHSFPDELVREWLERFGETETGVLCGSLNEAAPITIRVNTLKTNAALCGEELLREGIESHPTKLAPDGLILAKRINTQALASFKQGLFEMQDEGSQIISLLTGANPGMTVVDACAGGGGKTLHLAALMQGQGRLVAVDVQERRLNNIRERLRRAGAHADVLLAGRDRESLAALNGKADVVL
ncbi:MAG: RsmB/NOP family class I SAM-dependent RNA methyltransferase, partial [Bacteroidota bacterium]